MKRFIPVRAPLFPFLLIFALTLGTAAGIATRYFLGRPGQHGVLSGIVDPAGQFPGKSSINVLVMGIDENYTNHGIMYTKNARTDTLFVVNLGLDTGDVHLLSIPRDSRVKIAGTSHWGKINGAFATGGVARARKTVEQFLGVPIDHYIVLKIDATKKLVDSIGGVDLVVEKDMDYDDNWGHLHIHFKKGFQHLDGDQAVSYIRFRHDRDGDFGRIRRQQQLLHAIIGKLKSPMMLPQLPSVLDTFKQAVNTSLEPGQLAGLMELFKSINPSQIISSYIPGADQRVSGVWFLVPDAKKKKLVVDWLLKGQPDAQIPLVQVLVEDGCGNRAAAESVCNRLRDMGFQATLRDSADRSDYAVTQVVDYDKLRGSGALVSSKLGLTAPPVVQPDAQADTCVEVIVGHDMADAELASRSTPDQ